MENISCIDCAYFKHSKDLFTELHRCIKFNRLLETKEIYEKRTCFKYIHKSNPLA